MVKSVKIKIITNDIPYLMKLLMNAKIIAEENLELNRHNSFYSKVWANTLETNKRLRIILENANLKMEVSGNSSHN